MHTVTSALGDGARWRIVELLAECPRSVGELADLTGLRQPQTTKHLQTLARAGLVTVFPLGQRRVYAVESAPLQELASRLTDLVETISTNADERAVVERYRAAIEIESMAAERDRWADGRSFTFERELIASRELVWQHWTDPTLLRSWWAPASMTITDCVIVPKKGGRTALDYRDAEGRRYRSEGRVTAAKRPGHLEFDLSVLDTAGAVSFTGHYDLTLEQQADATRLTLDLTITETTVEAVPYIAGIETGWSRVLDNLADTLPHSKEQP
ncbi:metalloregulator ArsR/SmtB family transcription factor [Nocardia salmonicida]|uniref:metalloregulator ArsR/SmtB family transcription factor n=1 Tax=Nocardia salmonicida TaxID=53431 RepID=UPI00379CBAB9